MPGHAVWNYHGDPLADASWYLQDFQCGEPRFYLEHIRRGVILAADEPGALLVFSGSQTARAAGPRSEGQGYWLLAEYFDWWKLGSVRSRATTEEFACDSYQNVLFSLCRFREFSGTWPARVTVAGWGFKAERFSELHRTALRLPESGFRYAAVNEPVDLAAAERQEAVVRERFLVQPYGGTASVTEKRINRNPFQRQHGYAESCPELRDLLRHGGPDIFRGPLPW